MIPKEFKNTNKLLKEFNALEEEIELNVLKLTDPELADQIEAAENYKNIDVDQEPEEQYKQQINENFNKEYIKFNKAKKYFLGCSKDNYITNYEGRLEAFNSIYTDSNEQNFIYEELKAIIFFSLPFYIAGELVKSINYSLERTKEFLIKKLEDLNFNVHFSINENGLETLSIKSMQKDISIEKIGNSNLKWEGDITQLVELGMALIASNSINVGKSKLSENKFYELLANFFNIEKLYHEKLKSDIRRRTKDTTVFLPFLDETLKKDLYNRLK
jgi:hypothetical protein